MKTIALTSCILWLSAVACAADGELPADQLHNWAQWRGPLANGVAPLGNPPLQWDENTNIKWKAKIPGRGTGTPIVWGDQIFLTTAIETDRTAEPVAGEKPVLEEKKPGPDAKKEAPDKPAAKGGPPRVQKPTHIYQFVVLCIDRRTGLVQWQHLAKEEVPHEGHHPDGSFAAASATTDGKRLYVSFGSRGVYCYDLQGHLKWSRDLGKMNVIFTFGEGTSPVVHGDSVFVNWDHQKGSFLICLDAATGETKWKVDRDETTTWATPLVVEQKDRTQLVVHGVKRVRGYDMKNGDILWECGGQAPSAIPSPVTDGKLVFAMTGYMGNALYAIPLDSTGDITKSDDKVAWKRKQPGTSYVPSPILYGDLLYFLAVNKGVVSCLNATTGEVLIDRKRLEGIDNIYASPVGAADRIYFTGREDTTVVIKRGGELEILATNKLDDHFDGSAAIVGSQIFLRGNENLYCISAE